MVTVGLEGRRSWAGPTLRRTRPGLGGSAPTGTSVALRPCLCKGSSHQNPLLKASLRILKCRVQTYIKKCGYVDLCKLQGLGLRLLGLTRNVKLTTTLADAGATHATARHHKLNTRVGHIPKIGIPTPRN